MQKEVVFHLDKVSVVLGKKQILENVNLTINSNEIFGVIGPSGAGKTTLLKTLIGYHEATSGSLHCRGMDVSSNPREVRKIVGFASQDNCFYEKLTIEENLRYFGSIHQLDDKKIVRNSENFLKLTELWGDRKLLASSLSGGMKRRLDLCCAMMNEPSVLIMDEPTAGLDPLLRKHMLQFIRKIQQLGITIIISSHLLDDIEHLCDRVAVFSNGKLLVVGSPDQLKDYYTDNEEIHVKIFPGNYNELLKFLYAGHLPIKNYRQDGDNLVLYTKSAERVLHGIISYVEKTKEKIIYLEVNKPNLSEVFEAFTQK